MQSIIIYGDECKLGIDEHLNCAKATIYTLLSYAVIPE